MPVQDSVEVSITVDGVPLKEFVHPEIGPEKDRSLTRLVEASTDKSFDIKVTLLQGFAFRRASFVAAELSVDDDEHPWIRGFDRDQQDVRRGALLKPVSDIFKSFLFFDKHTETWEERGFSFGDLRITEGVEAQNSAPRNLQQIGLIRVKVYRASSSLGVYPQDPDLYAVEPLDEVPEQSAKHLLVKKNVKYMNARQVSPPDPSDIHPPLSGEDGKSYEFSFLYRERKYLQHLGCIPRSPSPSADPNAMSLLLEETVKSHKLQTKELKQEILQLKLQLEKSSATNSSTSTPTQKPSSTGWVKTEVKGEGGDEEIEGKQHGKRKQRVNDLLGMPPPPKKQKEEIWVDLTED